MVSRVEVVKSVEGLQEKLQAWDAQTDNKLPPVIVNTIKDLGEKVQTEDVPPDAYELVWAIDEFTIRADQWLRRLNSSLIEESDPVEPGGSGEMWTQWQEVLKAAKPRQKRLPVPAILMSDQKVPPGVIAKKFGFLDDRGRPDLQKLTDHMVAERNGKPSPHFDPETWVAPQDREYATKWKEKWEGRSKRLADLGYQLTRSRKQPPAKRQGKWSIEDLAHQPHMTIEVLARKMGLSQREAEDQLAMHGLKLDGTGAHFFDASVAAEAQARSRESDEREALQHVETYEDLGTDDGAIKERVLRMASDKRKPQTIAKALTFRLARDGRPAVTYQQVKRILDGAREAAAV